MRQLWRVMAPWGSVETTFNSESRWRYVVCSSTPVFRCTNALATLIEPLPFYSLGVFLFCFAKLVKLPDVFQIVSNCCRCATSQVANDSCTMFVHFVVSFYGNILCNIFGALPWTMGPFCGSPWYDLRGWLGAKNQLSIYLSLFGGTVESVGNAKFIHVGKTNTKMNVIQLGKQIVKTPRYFSTARCSTPHFG